MYLCANCFNLCYNPIRSTFMNLNNGISSSLSNLQQINETARDFRNQTFQQNENFKQLCAMDNLSQKD